MTLYTTPSCPKCKILKGMMESKNIRYMESTDIQTLIDLKIMSVPALEVDGVFYVGEQAIQYVQKLNDRSTANE